MTRRRIDRDERQRGLGTREEGIHCAAEEKDSLCYTLWCKGTEKAGAQFPDIKSLTLFLFSSYEGLADI